MRGTRPAEPPAHLRPRIIPARAGNAPYTAATASRAPDHPRACGERAGRGRPAHLADGSSPRVRGTRVRDSQGRRRPRIIPARAGNAIHLIRLCRWCSDHPRACGERRRRNRRGRRRRGSSPRVRGTRISPWQPPLHLRIIPARAGNATAPPGSAVHRTDHPRACGEREIFVFLYHCLPGSSPRVRGTRSCVMASSRSFRIIPARAGNAKRGRRSGQARSDHPRACGERQSRLSTAAVSGGSSPRVRGTPIVPRERKTFLRIIPARAGNASSERPRKWMMSDHPRACGERDYLMLESHSSPGSSPRVRGTPRASSISPIRTRIIPARAGNAPPAPAARGRPPDHPRACGERASSFLFGDAVAGSSPRVRGTLWLLVSQCFPYRIIPARAGNASNDDSLAQS